MRAAPRGERDRSEPEHLPLPRQHCPEIHVPRSRLGAPTESPQHFRTYFIALTTNPYSTMHYDVASSHKRQPFHHLHAALQHSCRRPPPSRVALRHHLLV